MTLRYNNSLVAEGAIKDSEGNKITTTYAKSSNLATVATSGSYNDLTNTPTIPAAQVQSDWNETDTSSKAYIQNKPNIPSGVIVDQTFDGTSTNAQSGVAIEGELANYALSSSVPTDTSDLTNSAGYITGISGSDVTTALGYTPANTTLSNLGATSSTNFDGQWVASSLNLFSGSKNVGTYDFTNDLTSYLPNDNYWYEVIVSGWCASGENGWTGLSVITSLCSNTVAFTRQDVSRYGGFCVIAIVESDRVLKAQVGNKKFADSSFNLTAYRRLGTNS